MSKQANRNPAAKGLPLVKKRGILTIIGPGLLVAATGVGAGDLATAGFAGSKLGYAVLWVVLVGAGLKFILNENLARWQIATGQTILEGAMIRLGRPLWIIFGIYLIAFSYVVGQALISACGATVQALAPVFEDPATGKTIYGIACSILGLILVRAGGFAIFERIMAACIALMFITVIITAILLKPDWSQVATGLITPRIPQAADGGLIWSIALMGGVGGTLTVICYAYWMKEAGRTNEDDLPTCRLDLAVAYTMTALFGIAMIIIAAGVKVEGSGSSLLVQLADQLGAALGPTGRWVFLIGTFGAVFSSLLGVWQAVPYVFADFWNLRHAAGKGDNAGELPPVDTKGRPYRGFMLAIALVPAAALIIPLLTDSAAIESIFSFKQVQKYYAVIGAMFIPALAAVLLILNSKKAWIGQRHKNGPLMTALLGATLLLAALAAAYKVIDFIDKLRA